MLQQIRDLILGKMKAARRVNRDCIDANIKYVVKLQEEYNEMVGADERLDLLDDLRNRKK